MLLNVPEGAYASVANRAWENDVQVRKDNCDPNEIDDIAEQLIDGETGKNFRVILGGGRRHFRSNTTRDEEHHRGSRGDNKDLIQKWLSKANESEQRAYVWNAVSQITR